MHQLNCYGFTLQILHITWIPPPTLHLNGHLTEYIIWYKEVHSANPTTVPVKEQSKTLRGLLPWATYVVKVAAVTSGGLGPFSEEVKGTVLGEHGECEGQGGGGWNGGREGDARGRSLGRNR